MQDLDEEEPGLSASMLQKLLRWSLDVTEFAILLISEYHPLAGQMQTKSIQHPHFLVEGHR